MPTSRHCARRIFPLRVETLDKGHGRLARRQLLASTALNDYVNFPPVAQVCRLERETVFAITSLTPAQADPHALLPLHRGPWGIENRSHYVRDVSFDEDRSRIRVGTKPAMMAGLRNFAIASARLQGFITIASALRAFAHPPRRALAARGV